MSITGIERIVYGVEDMDLCRKFFADWGLKQLEDDPGKAVYETLDGSQVVIRPADSTDLPPPLETGSTARQVVWGVESDADLDGLANRLATEEGFKRENGSVWVNDPNGLNLRFVRSGKRPVAPNPPPANTEGRIERIDQRGPVYDRAEPIKIGHVVFFAANLMETVDFYVEKVGFVVSDYYPESGYFLRCAPASGHHSLFLLKTPDNKRGLNHVAFTVRDVHEVFGGGLHISRQGWDTQIGPGRHPISAAYFWYVKNPAGALAEYYADEDFCTENWEAKSWDRSNENYAEWAIMGGLNPNTRRQASGPASD